MAAADPAAALESPAAPPVDWKRNLVALWIAQFTAIFGFAFVFPFLPLFLHQDLGIRSPSELALWTGIAASATGFAMAVASPIWGTVADRYGRRQMVLRAMVGGGIVIALTGLVQNAPELAGARLLLGLTSGTVAAGTALVAAETPVHKVGWALGIQSSAVAMGRALGPMTGGFLASFIGLRWVFVGGGVMILLATIPVFLMVRESPRPALPERRSRPALLQVVGAATASALAVLILCQGLLQFSYGSASQLIVLRILELHPEGAAFTTGVAFAAVGLATALAAVSYSRLVPLLGFRWLAVLAAVLMGGAIASAGHAPTVVWLVMATAAVGLLFGVLNPAVSSMIGLESPSQVKATVFGISASASSIGMAVGPLAGGSLSAVAGLRAGLYLSAAVGLLLAVVLAIWGREPAAPAPAR